MREVAIVAALVLALPAFAGPTKVYHLKDGRKIAGEELGSMGGKIMVKQEDGKRVLLAEKDIARTEVKEAAKPADPAPKQDDAPPCVYKGKARSREWVDDQYERFKLEYAVANGRVYSIGETLLYRKHYADTPQVLWSYYDRFFVSTSPPTPGTELRFVGQGTKVLQVLKPTEALFHLTRLPSPSILYHVKGIDATKLVDGMDAPTISLLYAGTFQYVSQLGTPKTIQSFVPYVARPLTREQFLQVIKAGIELVEYRFVKKGGGRTIKGKPVP